MRKSINIAVLVLLSIGIIIGCATIVGNPTQLLPIQSAPTDATVLIKDEQGVEVFKGTTPTQVTLQKSTGKYWGKKTYTLSVSKPGYKAQTIPIESSANGWYVAGNFAFGGLIGWFIVDPFNGNMYSLSPESISATLPADDVQKISTSDGRVMILSTEDLPPELLTKLQRIN